MMELLFSLLCLHGDSANFYSCMTLLSKLTLMSIDNKKYLPSFGENNIEGYGESRSSENKGESSLASVSSGDDSNTHKIVTY